MKSRLSFAVVLVSAAMVVVVSASTIPVSSSTENSTSLKDVVSRLARDAGNQNVMNKQRDNLRKMCRPRLVTVSVPEVLGHSSNLLDNPSLFPKVLAVKRCNATCNYCGDGLLVPGDEGQECTAMKSRNKKFKIQYSLNNEIQYDTIRIKVDFKCECRRDASITTTTETTRLD